MIWGSYCYSWLWSQLVWGAWKTYKKLFFRTGIPYHLWPSAVWIPKEVNLISRTMIASPLGVVANIKEPSVNGNGTLDVWSDALNPLRLLITESWTDYLPIRFINEKHLLSQTDNLSSLHFVMFLHKLRIFWRSRMSDLVLWYNSPTMSSGQIIFLVCFG